jgi:hypothetical protein
LYQVHDQAWPEGDAFKCCLDATGRLRYTFKHSEDPWFFVIVSAISVVQDCARLFFHAFGAVWLWMFMPFVGYGGLWSG